MDCLGFQRILGKKEGVILSKLHGLAVSGKTVPQRKTKIQPREGRWMLNLQKHPTNTLY